MTRRTALVLAAAASISVGVGPASAGTYNVTACGTSDVALNGINNTWVASATDPSFLNTGSACPAAAPLGGLYSTDTLLGQVPEGARAEWRFTAPANTSISALSLSRALEASSDDDWRAYTRTDTATLEGCQSGPGVARCVSGGGFTSPASPTPVTFSGLAAAWAAIGTFCTPGGAGCGTGLAVHHVAATLRQATVSLTDPVKPVLAVPTGPLTQSGVWVKGTLALNASATDAGGGLAFLRLVVDGTRQVGAGRVGFPCDFTFAVPCPASGGGSLSLNTTTLTDGTHPVLVQAEDAGGVSANTENTASWPLLVDNHAPGSPLSLGLTDTPVAGSPVGFSWVNPDQGVASPVETVKWQLTPLDGGVDGQAGSGDGTTGLAGGPTVARAGRWSLAVWLVDGAANEDPSTAAVTIVDTRPPAAATSVGASADVQTGAWQGAYTVGVPEAGMAPVASTAWQLCRSGGSCVAGGGSIPGPASYLATGTVTATGTYTFTVQVTDTKGRQSPAASTGFSWTVPTQPPVDTDGDGFPDTTDGCPTVFGTNNGCPASTPPLDSDGDGIPNVNDACPTVAGVPANAGCPVTAPPPPPPADADLDGIPDSRDACPFVAAPGTANGCIQTTPPPVQSNNLKLTGRARYVAATRHVVIPIATTGWLRIYQVRVKRGSKIGAATLIRTKAESTRLIITVPVGLRVPTRIEWRTPGTTKWFGARVYR